MNQKRPDELRDLEVRFSDSLFHAFDASREILLLNIGEDPSFHLGPWDKLTVTLIYERLGTLWNSINHPIFDSPAVIDGLQFPHINNNLSVWAQWAQKISGDTDCLVDEVESAIKDGLLRNNKEVRESISRELQDVRISANEYELAARGYAVGASHPRRCDVREKGRSAA
jgi:hypothetical protein